MGGKDKSNERDLKNAKKLDELLLKVARLKSEISNKPTKKTDDSGNRNSISSSVSSFFSNESNSSSLKSSNHSEIKPKNIAINPIGININSNSFESNKQNSWKENYFKDGLTNNDFVVLDNEYVLNCTQVLLERYKTATRVELDQIPRGYLLITNKRIFFLCEGMGESISKNLAKHLGAFIYNGIQMNMVDSGIEATTTSLIDLDDSKTISIFKEIPSWLDKTKSFVAPIWNIKCERIKTTFRQGITKNFIRFYIPLNDNSFEYYILYLVNPANVSQGVQINELKKALKKNNIQIPEKKYDEDKLSYI